MSDIVQTHHANLVAATVTTFTITGPHKEFRIVHREAPGASAPIWWTVGDTAHLPADPTSTLGSAPQGQRSLLQGQVVRVVDQPSSGAQHVIKLLSTGTPAFSIEAA